ncbi:hypothetical protein B296_00055343, partial [Ensete ventricosum]
TSPAFGKEGRRVADEAMKEIASSTTLAATSPDPRASRFYLFTILLVITSWAGIVKGGGC